MRAIFTSVVGAWISTQLLLSVPCLAFPVQDHCPNHAPFAQTTNGTVCGIDLPGFNQAAFFGIPYAQPPVGDLRLRHAIPYNHTYSAYPAIAQPPSCPGYAGFDVGIGPLSEDCLYLNIVRPSMQENVSHGALPVLVWIYGGGFDAGGIADPRYNMSYIVQQAAAMHKPILGVSINYRVGGWGFLSSREVLAAGTANIGLFDQRRALEWIQENIGTFGGDPAQVTIWGESAGAFSVGYHLVGFEGKHANLFRGAILESGSMLGSALQDSETITQPGGFQEMYDNVTMTVGCADAADTLACLRHVSYESLFDAFAPQVYTPVIDRTFLTRRPSESLARGLVADVAVLVGANTDEGTAAFWGPRGTLNTSADVAAYIKTLNGGGLDHQQVDELLKLYPDDPAKGCPYGTGEERFASQGWMYKRGAAIAGDIFVHAGRRRVAEFFAARQTGNPTYSYRFDQAPWNGVEELITTVAPVYSTHYVELIFVFNNPSPNLSNSIGPYASYHDLSTLMSRSWVSFVHDLNPNHYGLGKQVHWPAYTAARPQNIVFRAEDNQGGVFVEQDTYRTEQLAWWNTHWSYLRS